MSMRALPIFAVLLVAGVVSCNDPGPANRLTGGDALPSTILDIDVTHDTTVTTPGGAILKIPQGALDAGGATSVKLEVKEAYLLEDMVRGKLFTRSEDQLLSSGGMISINAAAGQNVTIRQPINVFIPTQTVQHGMMVYEGQADTGGNMNWINPRPLSDIGDPNSVSNGKSIFETNCSSCHGMQEEMTGPPLAWITQRRDKRWLADYTRNNALLLWRGDAYSCFLFNRYKKTSMPVFHFSDEEVNALYAYISHASQGIDSNSVTDLKKSFDSCAQADPVCSGAPARTSTEYTQPKTDAATGGVGAGGTATGGVGTGGTATGGPGTGGDSYYGFTLDKFGWNNVGIVLKDLPGVQESDLLAQVKGVFRANTEVYLGIPSLRVLEKGTFSTDKNDYYFYTADGKIPLPQGVAAYIVVRCENEGQPLFGKAKWVIARQQLLSPEPAPMSQEDIAHAIHELPFDSTYVQAAALDSTGSGTSVAGSGGTDSSTVAAAPASGGPTADTAAAATGASGPDAAGASGAGSADPAGSGTAAASGAGVVRTGRRHSRRAQQQHLSACPCWCDEMDYRKADSIARAAGAQ